MFLDFHTHFSNVDELNRLFSDKKAGEKVIYNWIMNESGEIHELKNLIEAYSDEKFSVGIHPWYINSNAFQQNMDDLHLLLSNDMYSKSIVMIGECGLDSIRGAEIELQEKVFTAQLELALHYQKPLVLHVVKAFDSIIRLSKNHTSQIPICIHGFNKSISLADQLWKLGYGLSFGVPKPIQSEKFLAFKNKFVDELFFFETDQAEEEISEVYKSYSFLTGNSVNTLKDSTFANWKKIGII